MCLESMFSFNSFSEMSAKSCIPQNFQVNLTRQLLYNFAGIYTDQEKMRWAVVTNLNSIILPEVPLGN